MYGRYDINAQLFMEEQAIWRII